MDLASRYTIHPLGDSAVLLDFGNTISEEVNAWVLTICDILGHHPFKGFMEVVPAYSSLAVFFDPFVIKNQNPGYQTAFDAVKSNIEHILVRGFENETRSGRHYNIPVCYEGEYGKDTRDACDHLHLTMDEFIHLHTSRIYRVYMIGFLPGFPYMGEVDARIALPRKSFPVTVKAGSVGIAGIQTGIYPFDSPGGWQILGRTPMNMFTKQKEDPVLLRAGDHITFYPITTDEFEDYQSRTA